MYHTHQDNKNNNNHCDYLYELKFKKASKDQKVTYGNMQGIVETAAGLI